MIETVATVSYLPHTFNCVKCGGKVKIDSGIYGDGGVTYCCNITYHANQIWEIEAHRPDVPTGEAAGESK